jgi:hypothetical protein
MKNVDRPSGRGCPGVRNLFHGRNFRTIWRDVGPVGGGRACPGGEEEGEEHYSFPEEGGRRGEARKIADSWCQGARIIVS